MIRAILYSKRTCPDCTTVKQFIQAAGLSPYIVVKDVADEPLARAELLSFHPTGGVPTVLFLAPRQVVASDATGVINALRQTFGRTSKIRPAGQATPPASNGIPWEPIVLLAALVTLGAVSSYVTRNEAPHFPVSR